MRCELNNTMPVLHKVSAKGLIVAMVFCFGAASCKGSNSNATRHSRIELEDQFDIFDRPKNAPLLRTHSTVKELSAQARQLMQSLKLESTIVELNRLQTNENRDAEALSEPNISINNSRLQILVLQSVISRRIQKASLQIQETFANIDGDIAQNNMLLAYASSKQDRADRLNNIATFLTIGTFGLLESSLGRSREVSDTFGILGASSSIGLPLLSLKPMHFNNPRQNQPRTNMLAAIFDVDKNGDGYEPIVWQYVTQVPPASPTGFTRRQMLLNSWRSYRNFKDLEEDASPKMVREIIEAPSKENKLTVESLKTRAQLLLDVRALVQALYRDLAELDNLVD